MEENDGFQQEDEKYEGKIDNSEYLPSFVENGYQSSVRIDNLKEFNYKKDPRTKKIAFKMERIDHQIIQYNDNGQDKNRLRKKKYKNYQKKLDLLDEINSVESNDSKSNDSSNKQNKKSKKQDNKIEKSEKIDYLNINFLEDDSLQNSNIGDNFMFRNSNLSSVDNQKGYNRTQYNKKSTESEKDFELSTK